VVSEQVKPQTLALAALVATIGVAGCGSNTERRALPQPPRLPRALVDELASQSDEIARALDAQDPCRASTLAHALQANTIAAINARRVPAAFQEALASTVTDLAGRIRCVPPPEETHGQGRKGKGKAKGKHKGEGDD
jgi:outer membrane murein-binding lipoprotein Lpp